MLSEFNYVELSRSALWHITPCEVVQHLNGPKYANCEWGEIARPGEKSQLWHNMVQNSALWQIYTSMNRLMTSSADSLAGGYRLKTENREIGVKFWYVWREICHPIGRLGTLPFWNDLKCVEDAIPPHQKNNKPKCTMHGLRFIWLLLFYAIAAVFQLHLGSDMMHEIRRRKPKPTLWPTQGIFILPHHVGMAWEELTFDDAVSYAQRGNGLQHS